MHLRIEPDLEKMIDHEELRRRINHVLVINDVHVRTFVSWQGNEIHFKSSNFAPWKKEDAEFIAEIVQTINLDLRFKKRKRQVRDAFNKCKDSEKIEEIAKILGV